MATKIKVISQELLYDNAMWGVGSVISMEDEGRAKYLIGMLRAEKTDLPESKRPSVPPPRMSNQAEEIGQVIANALNKGMTSREFQRDAEQAALDTRGRKVA